MITKVEPTGILFTGICDIQTEKCTARVTAPLTAVWSTPGRTQTNVCRACLEEMVRTGEWQVSGARIDRRADVAVFDDSGKLQLVVEAKYTKSLKDTSTRAMQIRQNLIAHAGLPPTPFFMVAFPDYFYLWKQHLAENGDRPADYNIDASDIIQKYMRQNAMDLQDLSPLAFEKIIYYWMNDVTHTKDESEIPEWLKSSGVYSHIKNGSTIQEASVY